MSAGSRAGRSGLGLLVLLAGALLAGCDEAEDPLLRAVLPDRGAPGAAFDVVGERLEGEQVFVHVGGVAAEVLLWQPARLRARVPQAPLGAQLLVVSVDGRVSNPLAFEVDGAR